MDNKLINFSPVYVIHLADQKSRLISIQKQFSKLSITNYTIVDAVDARKVELSTLVDGKIPDRRPAEIGCIASHIKAMKLWLDTSDPIEEFAIIAEDDLSLETVKYWNFSWDYVIASIPNDADIVQMVMIQDENIDFTLHKKPRYTTKINDAYAWSTAAYLIRRSYAEKLVSMFYVDGKTNFEHDAVPIMVADIALYALGNAYSIPLFTYIIDKDAINSQYEEFHIRSKKVFNSWWVSQAPGYSKEYIFHVPENTSRVTRNKITKDDMMFKILHLEGDSESLRLRDRLVLEAKEQLLDSFTELDSPTFLINDKASVSNFYKNNKITIDSRGHNQQGWKFGELGVWASNFKAWENFAKTDYEALILMEDDIVLEPSFSEKIVRYVRELPENWDIFSAYIPTSTNASYHRASKKLFDKHPGNVCEIYQSHSCLCYVVSRSGAEKLLELVNKVPVSMPVDTYLYYNTNINAYALKMSTKQICRDYDENQTHTTIQNNEKRSMSGLV